ncbi:MAG: DUF4139 domain-containing protein [Candidatus Kapaibacterium sp.]|nr:MAG: DUF4139 domain-containing protein [Candidatus Kapabacteria bacterium]
MFPVTMMFMRMRILPCSAALSLVAISAAWSQQPIVLQADSALQTSATIYSNAAIVRQQFQLPLEKGENLVSIERLPEFIAPNSLVLRPRSGGVSVTLVSFEPTVTSSIDILQAYAGRTVTLRQRSGVIEGQLLTPPTSIVGGTEPCYNGAILRTSTGELLLSPCGELVLPPPSPPVTIAPRIRTVLSAQSASPKPLELLYQCDGLQWQATYSATLMDNRTLELVGYINVSNTTRTTFRCNPLQLVAGSVNIQRSSQRYKTGTAELRMASASTDAELPTQETLDEYHIYTVPSGATILPNSVTTLLLGGPVTLSYNQRLVVRGRYYYGGYGHDDQESQVPVATVVEFSNAGSEPLPAGSVRVWQQDRQGALQFLGEDNIAHTPSNEKVTLTIGESFDVKASRREIDYKRLAERAAQYTVEYTIRNRKNSPAQVSVLESFAGDWEITASTLPYTKRSARQVEFVVSAAAGQVVMLRYTVQHRW